MDQPEIRTTPTTPGRRRPRYGLLCLFAAIALSACTPNASPKPAAERVDSRYAVREAQHPDPERYRAFLRFYSPLILKQAHEPPGLAGRDWVTNFYFDDDRLSNNRVHWVEELPRFVEGRADLGWQIRPTLYAHVIEFSEEGERSMVLVYHVYHAMQASGIHDWERIEIRVEGVTSHPGRGERVRFVVITRHSTHWARGPDQLSWYENETGKHVLVWQAPWSNSWNGALLAAFPWKTFDTRPRKAELRFVEEEWEQVAGNLASEQPALVAIAGTLRAYPVHYVFVPDSNASGVATLGAQTITATDPIALASGKRLFETSPGLDVRRICYELQDTADIFPTHWDRRHEGVENPDWSSPGVMIWMDTELRDEAGQPVIPAGFHTFLTTSIDDAGSFTRRRGYPAKHWFWGVYRFGRAGSFRDEAFSGGAPQHNRALANTCEDCLDAYWYQHDYFAHSGESAVRARDGELGRWLPRGWHRPERGGFDGRWAQLFDDRAPQPCPGARSGG